ncbi:uncharacterized protein LOC119724969 [Patiria miniata]|uniref:Nose resistant-to-fluoxetine protein N-terminal domain-containing protein n=1 Tax=Patiria miniata TaxID=46514 RepID=A0A913ZMF6_PATMI|nr:uncharacterized protein LOC119724969 [Patiria miniata]
MRIILLESEASSSSTMARPFLIVFLLVGVLTPQLCRGQGEDSSLGVTATETPSDFFQQLQDLFPGIDLAQDGSIEELIRQLLVGGDEATTDSPAVGDEPLQQFQDLLGEEVQAAIIEQYIRQLLGDDVPDEVVQQLAQLLASGSLDSLMQPLQDLLSSPINGSNQVQAAIIEQVIRQLLGDAQVSDEVVQQLANLLASTSLDSLIQPLQDILASPTNGSNPVQAAIIEQVVRQLLSDVGVPDEVIDQLVASGLLESITQALAEILSSPDSGSDQVQAVIIEQVVRQLLSDAGVPDEVIDQLVASGLLESLTQALAEILSSPDSGSDQVQAVIIEQVVRQLLSDAGVPDEVIDQLVASGLLDSLTQTLGEILSSPDSGSDQVQAVIIEQVVRQLLSDVGVPDEVIDQLVASGLLESLTQALAEILSSPDSGSDQVQAVIIEQVVRQLLRDAGVPDEVIDQLVASGLLDSLTQILGELISSPDNGSDQVQAAIIEQLIRQLLGDAPVPDALVEQVAETLASVSLNDLSQQLQALLVSNSSAAGLDLFSENSTTLKDVRQLLVDLGLVPEELDLQGLTMAAQNVLARYLQDNVLQNVSTVCANNTLQFLTDIGNGQPYASQMWLSNGDILNLKVLTTYNAASLGNFEQCQAVNVWNQDAPFQTKYCSLNYWASVATLTVGLCVPSSCTEADLKEIVQSIPEIGSSAEFSCVVPYPWKTGAIVTLCILGVILLLVTIGTVYHVIVRRRIQANITKTKGKIEKMEEDTNKTMKQKENEYGNGIIRTVYWTGKDDVENNGSIPHYTNGGFVDVEDAQEAAEHTKPTAHAHGCTCTIRASKKKVKKMGFLDAIMMGFSALHNGSKILNTKETAGNLGVLNGIRVISMWWIILGHSIYFITPFLDDPRYTGMELYQSFWFSAIIYSTVSVDTFFFLSGLLLTYLTLKHLQKANGRLNWFLFYLHRFIRITPAYMICIAVWTTLIVHFGEGPGKVDLFESAANMCRERWWTNLLYINNLYPFPGQLGQQCMGWSWYLANDMQFFVISPIIIYLLYKYSKLGLGLIVALCLASFGITAYIATKYGVTLGVAINPPYSNNNTIIDYGNGNPDIIYGKPYCRIPAYLVGMVFGYVFYKLNGQPFKMSKWINVAMWIVAVGVGLAIIYGPYRSNGEPIPQYAAVMYTVFSRAAFVMAVGWVAFACVTGYGGPVNALLSWGFWAPLSRITFGAYLLHPILMYSFYTTAKSQYHFTYIQYASMFISNTVFAYAAAFVLSIGVEGPVMGLEKALLGGGARGKKN